MIEVQVDHGTWCLDAGEGRAPAPPAGLLERAVRRALAARGIEHADVSLALLDDDDIRALNRDHLGHDRPTDVLAFVLWEPGEPVVVGDVYVGWRQALRQASAEGVAPLEEIVRLSLHGVLHVTGMDHPEPAGERAETPMYRLQEALVAELLEGVGPSSGRGTP